MSIEPSLQPLSYRRILNHRSSNTEGARLDVCAQGFWGNRHQRPLFDVRVLNPLAPSNCRSSLASTYRKHESLKRRHYEQRVRKIEQLQLPTKDLLLSWQTNASRTISRRSAGSGAQSGEVCSHVFERSTFHFPPTCQTSILRGSLGCGHQLGSCPQSIKSELLYSIWHSYIFPPCFCWFVSCFLYSAMNVHKKKKTFR